MPLSMLFTTTCAVALPLWLCVLLWRTQSLLLRLLTRRGLALICWTVTLLSVLLLSACGTAPSPAPTPPRVPAALLVPPKAPTLLAPKAPASRSMTPGPTTVPTQKPVPTTGSAFGH